MVIFDVLPKTVDLREQVQKFRMKLRIYSVLITVKMAKISKKALHTGQYNFLYEGSNIKGQAGSSYVW